MKCIVLLIATLTSLPVFAAMTWDQLEPGKKYTLTADVAITSELSLKKGDAFTFEEFNSGDIPVLFYTFKNHSCTQDDLKSEMVLFNPEPDDKTDDKSVGVELTPGCHLEIYVETRHYGALSVFEE